MPPKKDTGPSKKTIAKAQEKVIEDKTFGLKNKNKSKAVQKFIKGVETQVKKGNVKGGEGKLLADQVKLKESEKKQLEKENLLNSLFRSVIAAGGEGNRKPDPRVEEKIDLYTDQRELLNAGDEEDDTMENWDEDKLKSVVNEKEAKEKVKNKTDKVCMHFLDAVEKRKYGWRWTCPNGESCIYKHCLPPGYVLKLPERIKPIEERTLEEVIEEERGKLGHKGTPVTLDTFKKWREDKLKRKEVEVEKKRQEEIKKNKGGKGFNVLSGRALFKYDPTLFADDEGAAENNEYEQEEEQEEEDQREERKEEEDGDENEDEEDGDEDEEQNEDEEEEEDGMKVSKQKKNGEEEDNVQVNEDVFLGEDDVELPE